MRKNLYLFICFCIIISHSAAQTKLPGNIFFKTLPNGLDVLVVEDNSVPLATIVITCKNGSYTESPKFNGLSHLYEHMFFKANKDYSSQDEFMAHVSELGINYNGNTTVENVKYFFTLPKNNLNSGLKFMNSAIRFPSFNSREMKRENIVVDGEFQRHKSSPFFALSDAMDHHLWGDLYSRKNVIGNHDVIRSATPALMDSIKNKYYYPNNSLLTVAGDVNHEEVFKQVEAIYGDWKASPFDAFKIWPVPEFKPLEKKDYFIVESPIARVPFIEFNWQGPDTRNDVSSTYSADVFSYILNQNASKLNKALVQTGLALRLSINYLTLKHVGPITLLVVPNPNKVKECLAEMQKQIALFDSNDYVTDEQVETAKRKLDIRQQEEQEMTSDFVQVLSFWWASASIDYLTTYNDNLKKVTKSDLKAYVDKYIKDKPYCAGLLINPDMKATLKPEEFFTAQ